VGLSDDLPPLRRPLFLPVVLATVLLCLIAIGAGLALGARHRADVRADAHGTGSGSGPQSPATPVQPTTAPASSRPSGRPCPEHTQQTAQAHGIAGPLIQVLTIRTKTSVAYICRDGNGNLYYHANNTRGGGDWVEGKSAIFLTDVAKKGSTYEATADDGVVFSVSSSRLLIRHKDGSTEVQYSSP
jgi:hypothetical protein